jgi:hypothetical protein
LIARQLQIAARAHCDASCRRRWAGKFTIRQFWPDHGESAAIPIERRAIGAAGFRADAAGFICIDLMRPDAGTRAARAAGNVSCGKMCGCTCSAIHHSLLIVQILQNLSATRNSRLF